ncbi:26844_t:CDS:1, partial [Racocetra persica]
QRLKEYKKQRELKTESQSQEEPKTQLQFSSENLYVSEMVLESTDKSFTETQKILQPVTKTTMAETIQTEEFNPTEATAETNEIETTENKLEATNISTNENLATDIETDFISHKEMNNNDEKEFTLVISRKGKYKNKTKKEGYSPFTRVNKADKENNSQR